MDGSITSVTNERIMTRGEEILEAARTRAERHQVAEMELYRGDRCNYSYGRIYNSEIASFEAGAKYADEHPKSPWISVKDDLPCNHKELLHKNNNTKRVLVIDNGYPNVGEMFKMRNGSWGWLFSRKITHWMPIPEFPNHDDKH